MRLMLLALVACSTAPVPMPVPEAFCGSGSGRAMGTGTGMGLPITAPHGGAITLVAVTDQGDAAVTSDANDRLRIWPTLDGTREPVVLASSTPRQLAIARDGVTLVVGILDAAGGLELVRVDRDGRALGRARSTSDQPYLEVSAIASGMLALRADRAIERIDARGVSRGVLVPDAGSRVLSLATRHGGAVALLDTPDAPSKLRWIEASDQLMWGATVQLPITLDRIALAPNHRRVAGLVRAGANVAIFQIEPFVALIGNVAVFDDATRPFGFTDDDHAIVHLPSALQWWVAPPADPPAQKPSGDPWNTMAQVPGPTPEPASVTDSGAAIGDGLALAGADANLMIVTRERARYLGYRDLAVGLLTTRGSTTTLFTGGHITWLDDTLAARRSSGTDAHGSMVTMVLDDRHVIATRLDPHVVVLEDELAPPRLQRVLVRDLDTDNELEIGKFVTYGAIGFDPVARVLAIDGDTRTRRFQLDPTFTSATELAPLVARLGSNVTPCANGAAALSTDDDGTVRFATYTTPEKPSMTAIKGRAVTVTGSVIGIDRACRLVVARTAGTQLELWRYRGSVATKVASLTAPAASLAGGVPGGDAHGSFSADGSAVALVAGNEALVVDLESGTVRWRFALWQPHSIVFTGDDRSVIVASQGLLALDAATGRRTAATCGWHFGLADDPIDAGAFGAPTVCEEELP